MHLWESDSHKLVLFLDHFISTAKGRQEKRTGLNSKFEMSFAAQGLGIQNPHCLRDYEISFNLKESFTL